VPCPFPGHLGRILGSAFKTKANFTFGIEWFILYIKNMSKDVALVLSSGGARGIAHIGVIDVLVRRNYNIRSVAGTSMGALVAGFYAAGQLQDYRDWLITLDRMDVLKLVDFSISSKGLVKGKRIIEKMKEIIPDRDIEDLNIPYVAVATDIITGREKVFNSGKLYEAIRASISIPTVFQPAKFGGDYFVDGGVLNPIPVNRVQRFPNDLLVVSDVNGLHARQLIKEEPDTTINKRHLKYIDLIQEKLSNIVPKKETDQLGIFNLTNKSIGLMLHKISQLTLDKFDTDMIAEIPIDLYGTYDFHKAKELIAIGAEKAEKIIHNFEARQN